MGCLQGAGECGEALNRERDDKLNRPSGRPAGLGPDDNLFIFPKQWKKPLIGAGELFLRRAAP
jgi:hypothetical protein